MQPKCSAADNPDNDVYVDVSNGDPVHYECFQLKSLKVSESTTDNIMCNRVTADSDSVDKLVKNPVYEAYSKDNKNEEDVIEHIYETIPGQFYQDWHTEYLSIDSEFAVYFIKYSIMY